MGRSRYRIHEPGCPHFLTCTILDWIPVFTRPATVSIVLDSLEFLQRERGLKLYGYVVLENHRHWIAQAEDLPKEVHSFKSYTAKMLVRYLEAEKATRILAQLAFHKKKHKTDREHQVWEEGTHPQFIANQEMLVQKLAYIHDNPVKRGYVDKPEDWRYSSARNYAGKPGLIDVFTGWV